jgi:hypothetical protein
MVRIESGSGNGVDAKVGSDLRLYTDSVTNNRGIKALEAGDAYNINTGVVSISAETGMLYVKNNEDKNLFIEALAIGIGAGSFNTTSFAKITVIRNPTTGTLIESTPTTVPISANRLFSSSNTLTATQYVAGASGDTITDGDDTLIIAASNAQSRIFATIDLELAKGNSIGVKVDPNLSAGSTDVYVAAICHLITTT